MKNVFKGIGNNLGASIVYDFGKGVLKNLSKKETIQLVLNKIGVYKNISDFPERYVETLVELRLKNKPKEILNYFRDENVMKALYDFYYATVDSGLRRNKNALEKSLTRKRLKSDTSSLMEL